MTATNRRLAGAMCIGVGVAVLADGQPWWHHFLAITFLVAALYLFVPDGAE